MSRPPTSGRWPLFVRRRSNSRAAGMSFRVPSGLLPNAASELPCQSPRQPANHSPQECNTWFAVESQLLNRFVGCPKKGPFARNSHGIEESARISELIAPSKERFLRWLGHTVSVRRSISPPQVTGRRQMRRRPPRRALRPRCKCVRCDGPGLAAPEPNSAQI
jgi:hypothetical protein